MTAFDLTQVQAEAILNMRLRALRKLEETAIRAEHAELVDERKALKKLLKSPKEQQAVIAAELRALKKTYQSDKVLGARRTDFAEVTDEALPIPKPLSKKNR